MQTFLLYHGIDEEHCHISFFETLRTHASFKEPPVPLPSKYVLVSTHALSDTTQKKFMPCLVFACA